jgi:hypothetical protein
MADILSRLKAARQQQQLGPAASMGMGAVQGATFNFGDELYGAGAALIPGGQDYTQARDAFRSNYERANPSYRLAGELVGGLAVPGLGAGGVIARGGTALAKAGRAAGVGAAQGGVAGFGAGDGGLSDRALSAAAGAGTGAVLGGGLQATLGRLARAKASQVAPGSQEAQRRGIRQTRGQYTGDLDQLSREQELLNIRGAGGDVLSKHLQGQSDDIARELERTGQRVGGAGDLSGATSDFVGNLKGAEADAKLAVDEAYKGVRMLQGQVENQGAQDAMQGLAERFRSTIHDNVEGIGLDPDVGEYLEKIGNNLVRKSGLAEASRVNVLEQAVERAVKRGDGERAAELQSDLIDAVAKAERRTPTIQRLEGMRQALNGNYRREGDAKKRLGLQMMIGDFDDWLQETVTSQMFRGDDTVVEQLGNARGLSKHYHSLFGVGDKSKPQVAANNLLQGVLAETAGPDEAIRFLTRMNSIGSPGVKEALGRIKQASPEAFNMLRVAHFQNMQTNPRTGQPLTANQITTNLNRFVGRQTGLAREMYGPKAVNDMLGLASALKATDRQLAQTGNASRSAFTAANLMRRFARGAGLVAGMVGDPRALLMTAVTEGLSNAESLIQAQRAVTAIPKPAKIPALANRAAANIGRVAPGVLDMAGQTPQMETSIQDMSDEVRRFSGR